MSRPEMRRWLEFYRLFPFDDDSRFNRPAAIVAAAFGADSTVALRWLRREPEPIDEFDAEAAAAEPGGFSAADLRTMAALGVKPPNRKE